jgi:succinate dehydrogenase/fumarate reductase cytochrome b subunit
MVVPYLDKNHWSLYIMEEGCTIHCDSIPGFHNNKLSKEFVQNVRIAWALSRALNEDVDFKTFINNVDTILPKVFARTNSWECGHHVVFNFRTYLQGQGTLASFHGHPMSSNSTCHVTFYACYILLVYIVIA